MKRENRLFPFCIMLIWFLGVGCDPANPDNPGDGDEECVGESEAELCGGLECGSYIFLDRCGEERGVDCGSCAGADICVEGECRCESAEDSATLCAMNGLECGMAIVTDRCGDDREVDCSDCEGAEECQDNVCVCEPESDEELCGALSAGVCGPMEFTDRCGGMRTLECESCVNGASTLGAVRDGLSGEALEGAEIRIWSWPPSGGSDPSWMWPEGYRYGDPDFFVTTGESAGGVNFELAGGDNLCRSDASSGGMVERQWYRIQIERPGYVPAVFYREHDDYRSGDCPGFCPTSESSGCHRMDFEIWSEDEPYPMPPNLVVDSRDLEDHLWQCALLPAGSSMERVIGLRVRLGAGNAGHGPLHLQATPGGESGEVLQYIYWSDGTAESRVVESGTFEYFDDHFHIHFMEWFRMRLVNPVDECRDRETRSESCISHSGTKLSYCLHDLDPFDGGVRAVNDGIAPSFPDPPTCDTTEQGVSPGWKDVYRKRLPGQLIIIGSPAETAALGEQWIEAEVDPAGVLEDRDRSSTVARLLVTPPTDFEALCSDPATVRDCRGAPADFDADQRRQCRDYLNFVNP